MTALHRKLLRDLVRLRGQAITIGLVVAAGVSAYVAEHSAWTSLKTSRDAYYDRYRFADVFARLERAPDAVRDRLAASPGIATVHTRVVERATLVMPGLEEPAYAQVVSVPSDGEPPLNALHLHRGRPIRPEHPEEVLVLDSFAEAHGIEPGDRLHAVINGRRKQLRVTGRVLSPEFVYPMSETDFVADPRKFAVLWMNLEALQAAFDMKSAFNDVSIRLQPGASEASVLEAIDRELESYGGMGAYGRSRQKSNFMLEGELSELETFATVIPILFFGVAAFFAQHGPLTTHSPATATDRDSQGRSAIPTRRSAGTTSNWS